MRESNRLTQICEGIKKEKENEIWTANRLETGANLPEIAARPKRAWERDEDVGVW